MKFVFTSQSTGYGDPKHTIEFEAEQLSDVVGYFEQFLRGSGYAIDGQLDFVSDNTDYVVAVPMPGTIGGATIVFNEEDEVTSSQDKCMVRGCGLTRQQLGSHACYEHKCGLK